MLIQGHLNFDGTLKVVFNYAMRQFRGNERQSANINYWFRFD